MSFVLEKKAEIILHEAVKAIPTGAKVYFVGGSVRNALYYKFFGKKLPQRDYDVAFIGNNQLLHALVKNLRARGFVYARVRKNYFVLRKKKVDKPTELGDYVYLDIHATDEKTITKSLENNANFTINGFALSWKDAFSSDWKNKVSSLPSARKDLKNKVLHINKISHPTALYACIRFASKGFKPPPKSEVQMMLEALGRLQKYRFKRNVKKVFTYVGSEKRARRIATSLGVKEDIFRWNTIINLRQQKPKVKHVF